MTLLLVAAIAREFGGLPRGRKLDWPVHWARVADLGGTRLLMVANGVGAARAASAVAAAARPDAVVSFGFCGALDPALRPGQIFVATAVNGFPAAQPAASAPYASGVLVTVERVAGTVKEKAALREAGAAAVDMEAAGVAEEAARLGLPFFCVRSVTDLAYEAFTTDFNSVIRADGHFDTMYLLRRAVLQPVSVLPELLRLRGRCGVAARNLGDFIAGCRF
jgi:adenosylhomocysteine nucleosidase